MKNSKRLRISYNAPAILSFVLICFAVQLLNVLTKGQAIGLCSASIVPRFLIRWRICDASATSLATQTGIT